MSDEMLSQEEVDALLHKTNEQPEIKHDEKETLLNEHLTMIERDALGEIGNISFGSAATALSTLLNQKVSITTPTLGLIIREQLIDEFPHPHVAVNVKYTEGFEGENVMVVREEDAKVIADLMLGGDGTNLDSESMTEIQLSAVQEAMNQMMGSASTSMSTVFEKRIDISPPSIEKLHVEKGEGTDRIPNDDYLVKVSFVLKVGDLIDSKIMQIIPIPFAKEMVEDLLHTETIEEQTVVTELEQPMDELQIPSRDAVAPTLENSEEFTAASRAMPSIEQNRAENVQPVAFSEFEELGEAQVDTKNLDILLDIPLQVTVELGRTNRPVQDILNLSTGSIIELDKLAGEPVDILVNNKLIAKGEVVVIDENFGVRVTDIISQKERIRNLQ